MDKPELLTLQEASELLRLPRSTFQQRVRPTLPVVSIGSRKLVRHEDLDRWIEEHIVVGGVQGAKQAPKTTPHPIKE